MKFCEKCVKDVYKNDSSFCKKTSIKNSKDTKYFKLKDKRAIVLSMAMDFK
ncbi:hypothetical protein CWI39_1738p0020 [Hamiltosporidium magnivora]|uniref:Uncharacterized protein n=1 Tax=Hamiltosporidium magnivora TaxID=148818 RepID=A0A4Q9KZ30_9MICR|nr:hypothetical protein CWI39_1738p0020 [Hamiltosporidium magnivora]